MPAIALSLTVLGLVPFFLLAFGAVGQVPGTAELMLISLIDYAALVLGFAGGVHWGLALSPDTQRPGLRFGAGVVPLIIGWVGLVAAQMVAPSVAIAILIVGYLATILTEHRAARKLLVPMRYVWLRWGFSVVAVVMLVMVLILRGIGQTIVFY